MTIAGLGSRQWLKRSTTRCNTTKYTIVMIATPQSEWTIIHVVCSNFRLSNCHCNVHDTQRVLWNLFLHASVLWLAIAHCMQLQLESTCTSWCYTLILLYILAATVYCMRYCLYCTHQAIIICTHVKWNGRQVMTLDCEDCTNNSSFE